MLLSTHSRFAPFLAALILLGFSAAPASAATRITIGILVPVTPTLSQESPSAGGCSTPDSSARITQPYSLQWLKQVTAPTEHATAQVMIDLDSVGNLVAAQIFRTSGSPTLDDQALVAVRGSKYAPEVRNCTSFKRSYYLNISFDSPSAQ